MHMARDAIRLALYAGRHLLWPSAPHLYNISTNSTVIALPRIKRKSLYIVQTKGFATISISRFIHGFLHRFAYSGYRFADSNSRILIHTFWHGFTDLIHGFTDSGTDPQILIHGFWHRFTDSDSRIHGFWHRSIDSN